MRILDRYVVRQLLPVWLWCLVLFVTLSCLIDLFGHFDEILRYRIPTDTVWQYYRHFMPLVVVRASPLAVLFAAAFIGTRLTRYQELLAMNASGTSPLRASVPFLFVGWLVSVCIFLVNDAVVPGAARVYEQMRQEVFRGQQLEEGFENVALLDEENRLYHARVLDLTTGELRHVNILEHDRGNRPIRNYQVERAVWTRHGWLLLFGTLYQVGLHGQVEGEPQRFMERLVRLPVTPADFRGPQVQPDTMSYAQLRRLIQRLRSVGVTHLKRYRVELVAKLTLPLLNLVVCLIGYLTSTQPQLRGHLRGLGASLGWGLLYYLGVGVAHALTKQWPIPAVVGLWAPHVGAVWWVVRRLQQRPT